jgi:beta-galactosidase
LVSSSRASRGTPEIEMPSRRPVPAESRESRRVRLHPHGLVVALRDGDGMEEAVLPLYAGAMHYWRHSPNEWGAGLDAIKKLGFHLVDVYVPWGVHETPDGNFDFGERFARLDVVRFLKMADERGLKAILRPGPHINAELSYFGLPERVVWMRACQARTPRDNPVMLPILPVAFPVPSYASEAFHEESSKWLTACAKLFAPLRWPDGPIVLLQIDNEGALYFRDGPYDQDYHPDSIALYRTFLKDKYRAAREMRRAYGQPQASFTTIVPPHRFDARDADDLPRHLDWMEFHEHLLVRAMERIAATFTAAGFDGIPTTHNFPPGEAATPLNAGRMADTIDLVGLDYYHRATLAEHQILMRRTTELASRAEGSRVPAYAAEMGAGFPPFFTPIDELDSLYTLMAALAYGLRGYNLYMAVARDRWVGAPIDPRGVRRPFADKFEALNAALERTRFHTLRRSAPVRLVVPRALRRLARATHAFGPVTPALFNVLGAGYGESCLEDPLGFGEVVTLSGEAYLRAFERALTERGVPFAYAGGESLEASTSDAKWIICVTVGGVKQDLFARLRAVQRGGAHVTVGPTVPDRDGSMRRLGELHDARGLEVFPLADIPQVDALVARRIDELGLQTHTLRPSPDETFLCVHDDAEGRPLVAFVMNPSRHDVDVTVTIGLKLDPAVALEDALTGARIRRTAGAFEVRIPARTARMFVVTL